MLQPVNGMAYYCQDNSSATQFKMKKLIAPTRLILVLLLLLPTFAQAQEANRKIKIFLIGNSFSQDASAYLPELAKEAGVELIIGRAELGGCSLQRHWEIIEAFEANPDDPKGKSYRGKSLKELLSADTWDYITIQQNSKNSTNVDTYRPYAEKIVDYIHALQPQAEVLIHQTWAYRADSRDWGFIKGNEETKSQKEMYEKSRGAYHTIANELGLRILPVGDAFWETSQHPKFKFQPDATFNYETPETGKVPNEKYSLHVGVRWGGDDKTRYVFDSHHASTAGRFLGSLVWSGVMFGESPDKVKFVPDGVSPEFANHLKKTATKVVKANAKRKVAMVE